MSIAEIISAFFNSTGPGGMVVLTVVSLAAVIYVWLTRWILLGGEPGEKDEERNRFK